MTPLPPKTIAFATFQQWPTISKNDQLAAAPLQARGITVQAAAWDDPTVDWATFDAVILRSTWDYHTRPAEFRAWIDQLAAAHIPLWNAPAFVRWNMDKRYLRALADHGCPVVPTVWLEQDQPADLATILAEQGWLQAVVKPALGASGHDTWTVTPAEAASRQADLDRMVGTGGVLVQRLMPQVRAEGEWSIVFFGSEYSYSLIKRPGGASIFVQEEYGGSTTPATPPDGFPAQAHAMIQAAMTLTGQTTPPLYTRVDGLNVDGTLTLMELELIEPALYMRPADAEHFAATIADRLNGFAGR